MILAALLLAATTFAESKTLALQVSLDRQGYGVGTIDGQSGRRTDAALRNYCAATDRHVPAGTPYDRAFDLLFAANAPRLKAVTVTDADLAALVKIPTAPADKANLPRLGYEMVAEMYAERGHLSVRALARLNPSVDFTKPVPAGTRLSIPDFPSIEDDLRRGERSDRGGRPTAAELHVSLAKLEIAAFDESGRLLAVFPCSIARDKAKRPPAGELKIVTRVAWPNYTYTPDVPVRNGVRQSKQILPSGPNCPVGVVWLGLSLPGYGIHGTPTPETIGRAESHGCFRVTNWDAARLFALCREGVTRVVVSE